MVFALIVMLLGLLLLMRSRKRSYEELKEEAEAIIATLGLSPKETLRLRRSLVKKREKLIRLQDPMRFLLSEGIKL